MLANQRRSVTKFVSNFQICAPIERALVRRVTRSADRAEKNMLCLAKMRAFVYVQNLPLGVCWHLNKPNDFYIGDSNSVTNVAHGHYIEPQQQ